MPSVYQWTNMDLNNTRDSSQPGQNCVAIKLSRILNSTDNRTFCAAATE